MDSGEPELIAIYGRRRVGKTHLIRYFFGKSICFELTGVRDASLKEQLQGFAYALEDATRFRHERPRSWQEAFRDLIRYLEPLVASGGRRVVFLDELPWLASRNSRFLPAFEHFWNSWATKQKRLIVVICGSAASWMITKVLRSKGGLHNRVTRRIGLMPFTLGEAEAYLESRDVRLERRQIAELYMAIGGVPYYLSQVDPGRSAAQSIEAMIFGDNAPLRDEFDELYAALFEHHERHLAVVRALARKQQGLSRNEILNLAGIESGGNATTILEELETSGFIRRTVPIGRKERDALYRLLDEYTLFHQRWVAGRSSRGVSDWWLQMRGTPAWNAWAGYAFENLCLRHLDQILAALGIAGVQTKVSAWRHQPKSADEQGAQIDLVIDRRDDVVHLCEMKFSEAPFTITKKYAQELRTKRDVFRTVTGSRKTIFLTLIAKEGVRPNSYKTDLVDVEVRFDDLFA